MVNNCVNAPSENTNFTYNKFPKLTEEQKLDEREAKLDKYAQIKMNFGKHKGKTLDQIHTQDAKYLKWLGNTYKVDEKTTPTMKAILNYIEFRV